jgi:hypothetical protein
LTRLHRPILAAVLAAGLLGAPAAPAALTDDVAAVGAKAGAATEAATKAVPPLPVPIETPDVPKVPAPAPPPSAVEPPPPALPPSASSAADVVRNVGGGAEETAQGVAPAPSEAEGLGALPGSGDEADARTVGDGSGQRSADQVERASPLRWRAYVWPAIALRVEDAVMPLLARLDGLVDVQAPDVLGLSFSPAAVSGPVEIDRFSGGAGPPSQDRQSSSPGFALSEEKLSLLATLLIGLLAVVGLVSLARLVVGEELFEPRYWRGYRG